MSKKHIDQKPSKTAMMAALHRAVTNFKFNVKGQGLDPLAIIFLPPFLRFLLRFQKVQAKIRAKISSRLPGLHQYVIARTVWLDQVFQKALQDQVPQIVFLGAGYDTRIFRISSPDTRIFELDVAPTQKRKMKILRKKGLKIPQNACFISMNFNSESLLDKLKSAGWRENEKTLFIWEGVSYYLESDAVNATLEFVKQHAYPDSTLVFDYMIPLKQAANSGLYGVAEFTAMMQKDHANEDLRFFMSDQQIVATLEEKGFKVLKQYQDKDIACSFLIQQDGSSYGPVTGHFRFIEVYSTAMVCHSPFNRCYTKTKSTRYFLYTWSCLL